MSIICLSPFRSARLDFSDGADLFEEVGDQQRILGGLMNPGALSIL